MIDARSDSNIWINRHRPFRVLVSAITLVAFLFTTIYSDVAWAVGTSGFSSVGPANPTGPGLLKELNVETFFIPEYMGFLRDSFKATKQDRIIIHIHDDHCNYYAQKRISEIIEYISSGYGVKTINLEGGALDYDLTPFTDIADTDTRERASDYFVKEGFLNGAEYFAVNNPEKADLWGIENVKLYLGNLNVYRNSMKHKAEVDKAIKSLSYILTNLKTHIYSKELLDFDTKYLQYKSANIEYNDYLAYLVTAAAANGIDMKRFENLMLLNKALGVEAGVDFKKANDQCDALVDKLQKTLSRNALEGLVAKTVEFKSERISQKEFYDYLIKKADSVKIDMENYKELESYVSYIKLYNSIDKNKIPAETDALENAIREKLCKNTEQRELAALSKNLAITKNIFGITLTKVDYNYYLAHEDSFAAANYLRFIDKYAPLYKITAKPDPAVNNLDRYREEISQFYEYSLKRDNAFMANIKFPPARAGPRASILVTGGFHTENLGELFRKQGISYISIMPNYKSSEGYESPYYKILSGEDKLNVKKMMAEAIKSNLATPSWLCPATRAIALGEEAGEMPAPKPITPKPITPAPVAPIPAAPKDITVLDTRDAEKDRRETIMVRAVASMRGRLMGFLEESLKRSSEYRDREGLERMMGQLVLRYEKLLKSADIQRDLKKQESLKALYEYTAKALLAQDEDDMKLPFTPHGAKHSFDVATYMVSVLKQTPSLSNRLKAMYGKHYEEIVFLAGLLHDIGYSDLKKEEPKGYHAYLSEQKARKDMGDTLSGLFDMDQVKLNEFMDAILLHGMDKEPTERDRWPQGSEKQKYTRASDLDKPLLMLVRLADNMDVSRDRLRAWQKNPWFLRMLYVISNDAQILYATQNEDLSKAQKNRMIDERLSVLKAKLIKEMADRRDMGRSIAQGYLDGKITLEEARARVTDELGLQVASDSDLLVVLDSLAGFDDRTFEKIKNAMQKMNHETFPHFVGAITIRELRIKQDPEGNPVIQAILTDEALNNPVLEDAARYQIEGPGRSNAALRSLSMAGKPIAIEVQYGSHGAMTVGAEALRLIGAKTARGVKPSMSNARKDDMNKLSKPFSDKIEELCRLCGNDKALLNALNNAVAILQDMDEGVIEDWMREKGYVQHKRVQWHDLTHIMNDMLVTVRTLQNAKKARGIDIPDRAIVLAALGALYHDIGYHINSQFGTIRYSHEDRSIEFVQKNAPRLGITNEKDLEHIINMIRATKMRNGPEFEKNPDATTVDGAIQLAMKILAVADVYDTRPNGIARIDDLIAELRDDLKRLEGNPDQEAKDESGRISKTLPGKGEASLQKTDGFYKFVTDKRTMDLDVLQYFTKDDLDRINLIREKAAAEAAKMTSAPVVYAPLGIAPAVTAKPAAPAATGTSGATLSKVRMATGAVIAAFGLTANLPLLFMIGGIWLLVESIIYVNKMNAATATRAPPAAAAVAAPPAAVQAKPAVNVAPAAQAGIFLKAMGKTGKGILIVSNIVIVGLIVSGLAYFGMGHHIGHAMEFFEKTLPWMFVVLTAGNIFTQIAAVREAGVAKTIGKVAVSILIIAGLTLGFVNMGALGGHLENTGYMAEIGYVGIGMYTSRHAERAEAGSLTSGLGPKQSLSAKLLPVILIAGLGVKLMATSLGFGFLFTHNVWIFMLGAIAWSVVSVTDLVATPMEKLKEKALEEEMELRRRLQEIVEASPRGAISGDMLRNASMTATMLKDTMSKWEEMAKDQSDEEYRIYIKELLDPMIGLSKDIHAVSISADTQPLSIFVSRLNELSAKESVIRSNIAPQFELKIDASKPDPFASGRFRALRKTLFRVVSAFFSLLSMVSVRPAVLRSKILLSIISLGAGQQAPRGLPASAVSAISQGRDVEPQIAPMTRELLWKMMSDYLGRTEGVTDIAAWRKSNPARAAWIDSQFYRIVSQAGAFDSYFTDLHHKKRLIDGNHPRFTRVYKEAKLIVDKLLLAQGYDPEDFELYLMDTADIDAFTMGGTNKIFVSTGLLKMIAENGGSRDALAFILAHEFDHITQWLEDAAKGKEVDISFKAPEFRTANEYDADIKALRIMDAAGFSVKDATRSLKRFLARERGYGAVWQAMSMSSHPPTESRIRNIERLVKALYWGSFSNDTTAFSSKAVSDLQNRTLLRDYQHAVIMCASPAELTRLINEAKSVEELLFAMTIGFNQILQADPQADIGDEVLNAFERKMAGFISGDPAKDAFRTMLVSRVHAHNDYLVDLSKCTEDRKRILKGLLAAHGAKKDYEQVVSGLAINDLLKLIGMDLPPRLSVDKPYVTDKKTGSAYYGTAGTYEKVVGDIGVYNSFEHLKSYARFRLRDLLKAGQQTDPTSLLDAIDSLGRTGERYAPDEQAQLLSLMLKTPAIADRINGEEDIIRVMRLADYLGIQSVRHWQELFDAFKDFCNSKRSIIGPAMIRWLNEPADRRDSLKDYLLQEEIRKYPAGFIVKGRDPIEDLRSILNTEYVKKYYVFGMDQVTGANGSITFTSSAINMLLRIMANHPGMSVDQKLQMLDMIMKALEEGRLSESWTDNIYNTYEIMLSQLQAIPVDTLRQRMGKNIQNPFIARLIYLYEKGGVLSPQLLRKVFLLNKYTYGDWVVFRDYIETRRDGIMKRFGITDKDEQDGLWRSFFLPMALNAMWQKTGATERLTADDQMKSPSAAAKWAKTGYTPFFGEFHVFLGPHESIFDLLKDINERSGGTKSEISRLDFAKDKDQFIALFAYIERSNLDFNALLNEIRIFLPRSVYRNFALYMLLVYKVIRPALLRSGIPVSGDRLFDLEYVSAQLRNTPAGARKEIEAAIKVITPLLIQDTDMDVRNKAQMAWVMQDSAERPLPSAEYEREKSGYKDIRFYSPGGPLAQMDIYVPLLNKGLLIANVEDTSVAFQDRLGNIVAHFGRPSPVRDEFLHRLLDNSGHTLEELNAVLGLFYDESARDLHALKALELEKETYPERFSTLAGELGRIRHYFPSVGYTRDDILHNVEARATNPAEQALINDMLLQHPDNIRKKEQAYFSHYRDMARLAMTGRSPQEKTEFVLWVLGVREEKPLFIKSFEYAMKINVSSLRGLFVGVPSEIYANIGDSARNDFLLSLFYGDTGIFTDEASGKLFLDSLFDAILPNKKDSPLKIVYEGILKVRKSESITDAMRREEILLKLIKGYWDNTRTLNRLKGISAKDNESKIIGIFLESLGVIGVKLGQVLGYNELKDRANPIQKGVVFDMVAKIFGNFSSRFTEIGRLLGSASIKCVYAARLNSGAGVVVKAKRPEVEKRVREDMAFLKMVLDEVGPQLVARNVSIPGGLANRIEEMVDEELDFNREAQNQRALSKNIRTRGSVFGGIRRFMANYSFNRAGAAFMLPQKRSYRFHVPLASEVADNALMIEEAVDGIKLSDENALRDAGFDPQDIKNAVANELLRQIFVDGFYQADPHGGNIFILKDGTIAFIDLGSCATISEKNRLVLADLYGGMRDQDMEKLTSAVGSLGTVKQATIDEIKSIAASKDSDMTKLLNLFKALEKGGITLPKELLSIVRFLGSAAYLFEVEGPPSAAAPPAVAPARAPKIGGVQMAPGTVLMALGLMHPALAILFSMGLAVLAGTIIWYLWRTGKKAPPAEEAEPVAPAQPTHIITVPTTAAAVSEVNKQELTTPKWPVEFNVKPVSENEKAVEGLVTNYDELREIMADMCGVAVSREAISKIDVIQLKAHQKTVYKINVSYRDGGIVKTAPFIVYTPLPGRGGIDPFEHELNDLSYLSSICPDVVRVGKKYKKDVDMGFGGPETIPLVTAEFIDGDNLYDMCFEGKNSGLGEKELVELQKKAVSIMMDLWVKSGKKKFIMDMSLGQFVYSRSTGRVKLVDAGFLLNAEGEYAPRMIIECFKAVFTDRTLPPDEQMKKARWLDMGPGQREFFEAIRQVLGDKETIDFLQQAYSKIREDFGAKKPIKAYVDSLKSPQPVLASQEAAPLITPPMPGKERVIDKGKLDKWIQRAAGEIRRLRELIASKIEHITGAEFLRELFNSAERLNAELEKLGDEPYAVLWGDKAHDSARWVYEICKDKLKKKPAAAEYFGSYKKGYGDYYMRTLNSMANSGIHTYVFMDDAAYSGMLVVDSIEKITRYYRARRQADPEFKVIPRIIVSIPYMGEYYKTRMEEIKLTPEEEDRLTVMPHKIIPTLRDILPLEICSKADSSGRLPKDLGIFESPVLLGSALTYFDHKKPDGISMPADFALFVDNFEPPYHTEGTPYYEKEEADWARYLEKTGSVPASIPATKTTVKTPPISVPLQRPSVDMGDGYARVGDIWFAHDPAGLKGGQRALTDDELRGLGMKWSDKVIRLNNLTLKRSPAGRVGDYQNSSFMMVLELQRMKKELGEEKFRKLAFLDAGCGESGILGITAAVLGAGRVILADDMSEATRGSRDATEEGRLREDAKGRIDRKVKDINSAYGTNVEFVLGDINARSFGNIDVIMTNMPQFGFGGRLENAVRNHPSARRLMLTGAFIGETGLESQLKKLRAFFGSRATNVSGRMDSAYPFNPVILCELNPSAPATAHVGNNLGIVTTDPKHYDPENYSYLLHSGIGLTQEGFNDEKNLSDIFDNLDSAKEKPLCTFWNVNKRGGPQHQGTWSHANLIIDPSGADVFWAGSAKNDRREKPFYPLRGKDKAKIEEEIKYWRELNKYKDLSVYPEWNDRKEGDPLEVDLTGGRVVGVYLRNPEFHKSNFRPLHSSLEFIALAIKYDLPIILDEEGFAPFLERLLSENEQEFKDVLKARGIEGNFEELKSKVRSLTTRGLGAPTVITEVVQPRPTGPPGPPAETPGIDISFDASGLASDINEALGGQRQLGGYISRSVGIGGAEYRITADASKDISVERPARVVSIGPLVFVMLSTGSAAEIDALKNKIKGLESYRNHPGNVFFVSPTEYKWSPTEPVSDWALQAIASMIQNAGRFKGAIVFDEGSGDGLLSRVALRLGAERVVLIENKARKNEKARALLASDGFDTPQKLSQRVDFIEKDLSDPDLKPALEGYRSSGRPIVALINIGPDYDEGAIRPNNSAIELVKDMPELCLVINGGHRTPIAETDEYLRERLEPDDEHARESRLGSISALRGAGFDVEEYGVPHTVLIATKPAAPAGVAQLVPAATGIAHIESVRMAGGYYSEAPLDRDGKKVEVNSDADLDPLITKLYSRGDVISFDVQVQGLGAVKFWVQKNLGIGYHEVSLVLKRAIKDNKSDLTKLPRRFLIMTLQSSPYLAEDHRRNGFIGINRILPEKMQLAESKGRFKNLLMMAIYHELSHEVTGGSGAAFENAQFVRDVTYIRELLLDNNVMIAMLWVELAAMEERGVLKAQELIKALKYGAQEAGSPVKAAAEEDIEISDISVSQVKTFRGSQYAEVIRTFRDKQGRLMVELDCVNFKGRVERVEIQAETYRTIDNLPSPVSLRGRVEFLPIGKYDDARHWPVKIMTLKFPKKQDAGLAERLQAAGIAGSVTRIFKAPEAGGYDGMLQDTRTDVCPVIVSADGTVSANPVFNDPTTSKEVVGLFADVINNIARENDKLTAEYIQKRVNISMLSDFKRVLAHNRYESGKVDPVKFMTIRLDAGISEREDALRRIPKTDKQWAILDIPATIVYEGDLPKDGSIKAANNALVVEKVWKGGAWREGMEGEIVLLAKWKGATFVLYTSRTHELEGAKVHQWRSADNLGNNGSFGKQNIENLDDCSPEMCVMLDSWLYSTYMKAHGLPASEGLSEREVGDINSRLSAPVEISVSVLPVEIKAAAERAMEGKEVLAQRAGEVKPGNTVFTDKLEPGQMLYTPGIYTCIGLGVCIEKEGGKRTYGLGHLYGGLSLDKSGKELAYRKELEGFIEKLKSNLGQGVKRADIVLYYNNFQQEGEGRADIAALNGMIGGAIGGLRESGADINIIERRLNDISSAVKVSMTVSPYGWKLDGYAGEGSPAGPWFEKRDPADETYFNRYPEQDKAVVKIISDLLKKQEKVTIFYPGVSTGEALLCLAAKIARDIPGAEEKVLIYGVDKNQVTLGVAMQRLSGERRFTVFDVEKGKRLSEEALKLVAEANSLMPKVRQAWMVRLKEADATDGPSIALLKNADIVIMNNFYYLLGQDQKARMDDALKNMKPGAFFAGMDVNTTSGYTSSNSIPAYRFLEWGFRMQESAGGRVAPVFVKTAPMPTSPDEFNKALDVLKTGAPGLKDKSITVIDMASEAFWVDVVKALSRSQAVALDLRKLAGNDVEAYTKVTREIIALADYVQAIMMDNRAEPDVRLAVRELVKNAFVHGNGLDFNLPVVIVAKVSVEDKAAGVISVDVYDCGRTEPSGDMQALAYMAGLGYQGRGEEVMNKPPDRYYEWTAKPGEYGMATVSMAYPALPPAGTLPSEPMAGPGGGSIFEAANDRLAEAQKILKTDPAKARQLLERAINGSEEDGVAGYASIADSFKGTDTGRAASENLALARELLASIGQPAAPQPAVVPQAAPEAVSIITLDKVAEDKAVMESFKDVYRDSLKFFKEDITDAEIADKLNELPTLVKDPHWHCTVAIVGGKVVGFRTAAINPNGKESMYARLFVAEDYRDKKLGLRIFNESLKDLMNRKVETCLIHVDDNNSLARAFHNAVIKQDRESGHNSIEIYSYESSDGQYSDYRIDLAKYFAAPQPAASAMDQVGAAKAVIGDLAQNKTDIVIMPGSDIYYPKQSAVGRATATKLHDDYGQDTIPYSYKYGDGWIESLTGKKGVLEKAVAALNSKTKDEDARIILYVPSTSVESIKKIISRDHAANADRIYVIGETDKSIPENGIVDTVMHIVLAKGLLNYERYKEKMEPEAKDRIVELIKVLVANPGEITPAILDDLLKGIKYLSIKPVDFKDIEQWKKAQDQMLRSL